MRRLFLLLLAAALLPAGGCDSDGASDEARPARTPAAVTTTAPATAGQAAPGADGAAGSALNLTAPAIGGGQVELATYAGRPMVLWFWSPW